MPHWLQVLAWIAGGLAAVGAIAKAVSVLWSRLLLPGAKLTASLAEMAPAIDDFKELMADREAVRTLRRLSREFRSDAGPSLSQVMARIDELERRVAALDGKATTTHC